MIKKILVNYVDTKSTGKKNGSQSYFKIVDTDVCPYGLGVKNSCLDPYYTVAADAKYHKPGDVIYVDKLRGLVLPNGTNHTGFLIVRDIGKKITGPHRFDFFSGDNCNVLDPNSNPFASMNLQSKESKIPYRAIKDSKEKARIQAARNYPGYPLAKPITANKPQNYIQKGLEQLRSVDGKGGGQ